MKLKEAIEERTPVFIYTMTYDTGFAPYVDYRWLSLACCAPPVRKDAEVGTIVLGLSGKTMENVEKQHVPIYLMRVDEALSFDEYYRDQRFIGRADNIYVMRDGEYVQDRSKVRDRRFIHEHEDKDDTKKSSRVLLSENFIYFGDSWRKDRDLHTEVSSLCKRIEFTYKRGGNYRDVYTDEAAVRDTLSFLVDKYEGGVLGNPNNLPRYLDKDC